MKKSIVASLAVGMLVLAACGSDSGSSSGPQAEAADAAIAAASEEGIELDEECVNDLASQLSDEDAEAIVAAGSDGDAEVSDEGTAIGVQIVSCADSSDIADAFIEEMKASGQEFDEACVREGLDDVDLSTLAGEAQSDEAPEELINAVFDCFEVGG